MVRLGTCAFAIVTLVIATSAEARPPQPFEVRTNPEGLPYLSYPLEQRFKSFIGACPGLSVPLRLKNRREISAIHNGIITGLRLQTDNPVYHSGRRINLAGIFGYVYSDSERTAPQWEPGQFLTIADNRLLDFRFSALTYSATCGSVVNAALQADAGGTFPVATVQAALRAEVETSRRRSLELVHGRFLSPVVEMSSSSDVGDPNRIKSRFYSGIMFWDWYRDRAPGNYYLLSQFDGTVIYDQTREAAQGSISASAQGRLTLPFATSSLETSARTEQESELEIREFEIFIARNEQRGPSFTFMQMPSAEAAANIVESNTPSRLALDETGPVVESSQPKYFYAYVHALPPAYCNRSSWQVHDSRLATTVSSNIAIAENEPEAGADSAGAYCRFRLRYSPGAITAAQDIELSPYLLSTASHQNQRLRLPLGTIQFSGTAGPQLTRLRTEDVQIALIPGHMPPRYSLVWRMQFQLDDDGAFADINRIDTSRIRMRCPDNTMTGVVTFSPEFIGQSGQVSRTVQLTGRGEHHGQLDTTGMNLVECALVGEVVYVTADGNRRIRRPVPEEKIYYPRAQTRN